MKRNYKPGDTYRPQVTIKKLKHNVPSVVIIGKNRYILRNEDPMTNKPKGE